MTVNRQQVCDEVNADADDLERCQRCLDVTKALLDEHIAGSLTDPARPVPDAVYDEAHLAAAVELFNQRQAPNGVLNQQYDDDAGGLRVGTPIRIGSDPLRPAYPLLQRWLLPVIG